MLYQKHLKFLAVAGLGLLLFSCNSSTSSNTGDISGTSGSVGLAPKSFLVGGLTDVNAILDKWSGTYPVGIWITPTGQTSSLGFGTLQLSRTNNSVTATLKNSAGSSLVTLTHANSFSLADLHTGGMVFEDSGPPYQGGFKIQFGDGSADHPDSSISGGAWIVEGDGNEFYFQNNVTYLGPVVPPVFANLAGTWVGTQQAPACGQVKDTIVITAGGHVTVKGRRSGDCSAGVIDNQWDGQDDRIVPVTGGYEIRIDWHKNEFNDVQGLVQITIPSMTATSISQVDCPLASQATPLTFKNPVKQ